MCLVINFQVVWSWSSVRCLNSEARMWEERTLVETSIKGLTDMCLSDETSDDGEVVIGYNDG